MIVVVIGPDNAALSIEQDIVRSETDAACDRATRSADISISTMAADRIKALTTPHQIKTTQPAAIPPGGLTLADAPLIDAEILFRQPGPAL